MRVAAPPRGLRSGSGYAMAGLLVAIGVMGILMSVAMPPWRTVTKREKEAELIFRGEQYIRAIDLYQRRFPGAYPTDLALLVEQGFLRRAYPDPMTGEPFEILTQGSAAAVLGETTPPGETADGGGLNRRSDRAGRAGFGSTGAGLGGRAGRTAPSPFSSRSGGLGDDELGGIVGVVSRSSEESLLEYNGATRYNEWLFVHAPRAAQPGAGGVAAPGAGGGIGLGADGRAGIGGAAGGRGMTGLSRRPAASGRAASGAARATVCRGAAEPPAAGGSAQGWPTSVQDATTHHSA